ASYSMWPTATASRRFTTRYRRRGGRAPRQPGSPPPGGGGRPRCGGGSRCGVGCGAADGPTRAIVCACGDHPDIKDMSDVPRQIAHVNLNALNFDASHRFFTEALGFRQIAENAPLCFLHCDTSEHSSIVLAKTGLATLNHIAFEMPDFDSVMRGMGRMKENGYPIEWGRGRHGPGNNVFAYFCGPDEVPIEYTAEVLQIDDDYVPRGSEHWKFPPGRSDQWGITQPRSARYYRVQRLFGFTDDGYRLEASRPGAGKQVTRRGPLPPR